MRVRDRVRRKTWGPVLRTDMYWRLCGTVYENIRLSTDTYCTALDVAVKVFTFYELSEPLSEPTCRDVRVICGDRDT